MKIKAHDRTDRLVTVKVNFPTDDGMTYHINGNKLMVCLEWNEDESLLIEEHQFNKLINQFKKSLNGE